MEDSPINPFVRMDLTKPLEVPVGEELAQEWGQVLGEIDSWGEILNNLNGLQYAAQNRLMAAMERRSELARKLSTSPTYRAAVAAQTQPLAEVIDLNAYRSGEPEPPLAA